MKLVLAGDRQQGENYCFNKDWSRHGPSAQAYIATSPEHVEGLRFDSVHIVGSFLTRCDWFEILTATAAGARKAVTTSHEVEWFVSGQRVNLGMILDMLQREQRYRDELAAAQATPVATAMPTPPDPRDEWSRKAVELAEAAETPYNGHPMQRTHNIDQIIALAQVYATLASG